MSNIDQGGSAFPIVGPLEQVVAIGMTLRDYFAAKAPRYEDGWFQSYCAKKGYSSSANAQAAWSYEYADAMLRARSQS